MNKFYFFKYRGREEQNPWSKLENFGRQRLLTKLIILLVILLISGLINFGIFKWQQKNQKLFKQKIDYLHNLLQNPEQLKNRKNEELRTAEWHASLQWNYTANELLLALDKLVVELGLELQSSDLLDIDTTNQTNSAHLKLELDGEFVQLGKFIQRLSVFRFAILIEQLRLQRADKNRLKADLLLRMLN